MYDVSVNYIFVDKSDTINIHKYLMTKKRIKWSTLIDLNPIKLKYYLFMISLDKCNGSFIVLPSKISIPKKTVFNIITNKNKAYATYFMHFQIQIPSLNVQFKSKITCQRDCKIYQTFKKQSWNPSTWTCENGKYLKIIADTLVIACDEIISVMDIVSTKMTNSINVSINCHSNKVRCKIDCYILQTVLLEIILLSLIRITCYHYANHRSKQRDSDALAI